MCSILQVQWTLIPRHAPQPWIACSGCGGLKPFRTSGKARLNANGRKLDAWLIYKCTSCDKTWNRPIFERRGVRDIDPAVLEALQANDPVWLRAEAFNLDALKRKASRVDEFAEVDVEKAVLSDDVGWTELVIDLQVPLSSSLRLDRLLAAELPLSRSRLQALEESGALRVRSDRADALRRGVKAGTRITVDLSTEADRERTWRAAATGRPL
jgi:hypothetical protein